MSITSYVTISREAAEKALINKYTILIEEMLSLSTHSLKSLVIEEMKKSVKSLNDLDLVSPLHCDMYFYEIESSDEEE